MSEHKHWSEWLADRVIAEKKEPYVITSGITTSGPAHLGTLCEFLFPDCVRKELEARGKKVSFYFLADIHDAFDSVPLPLERYKAQLEPHLGKPLCDVPDPTGTSRSFGDHFLDEVRALMGLFGVKATVLRVNELYSEGRFDEWARFFLMHEAETRRIVEESSGKQEKTLLSPEKSGPGGNLSAKADKYEDWSPIMPICAQCGRVATTRVLEHNARRGEVEKYAIGDGPPSDITYSYACDRDVRYTKGCGYRGTNAIADHRYKLTWRIDWPAKKQIFRTSIEGAGMDHHTKGGSEDTCHEITTKLMKADYHIPFKYGFILFQGRKYSKSKGIGMGVSDLVKLVPPEILEYILVKPDLEENVDINPTAENLLRIMEDFQLAAELAKKDRESLNRHERKMAIAFELSSDRLHWKVPFIDVLLYYQIYHGWDRVAERTGDPDGVGYLRPFIEEWMRRDFMPDDYRFRYAPDPAQATENAKLLIKSLRAGMDPLAIHNAVFDFAKAKGLEPKALFAELYRSLLGKERGPRMGKLLAALGVERVKKDMGV